MEVSMISQYIFSDIVPLVRLLKCCTFTSFCTFLIWATTGCHHSHSDSQAGLTTPSHSLVPTNPGLSYQTSATDGNSSTPSSEGTSLQSPTETDPLFSGEGMDL